MKSITLVDKKNNKSYDLSIDQESAERFSLLHFLKRQGIALKSSCGGHASCGDCVIKVQSGDAHLNELRYEEKKLLGNVYHITAERLSCQCYISTVASNLEQNTQQGAHVVIDVTEHNIQWDLLLAQKSLPTSITRKKQQESSSELPGQSEDITDENAETNPKVKLGGGRKPKAFKFDEEDD